MVDELSTRVAVQDVRRDAVEAELRSQVASLTSQNGPIYANSFAFAFLVAVTI